MLVCTAQWAGPPRPLTTASGGAAWPSSGTSSRVWAPGTSGRRPGSRTRTSGGARGGSEGAVSSPAGGALWQKLGEHNMLFMTPSNFNKFSKNLPWGRRESQAEVMSKIRKRRETSADITIFRKTDARLTMRHNFTTRVKPFQFQNSPSRQYRSQRGCTFRIELWWKNWKTSG